MKFGYFTLSDNNYRDNPRTPNAFVRDIVTEALYAETLGMHSAWIGEHHFPPSGSIPARRSCSPTSRHRQRISGSPRP